MPKENCIFRQNVGLNYAVVCCAKVKNVGKGAV